MSETDDLETPSDAVEDAAEDVAVAEANEADAAEQRAALDDDAPREWSAQLPDEANEADAAEQLREVRLDEDEYR
ncbi:hypothetical protein [Actinomadura decatromicini]|uniref:Uncharacterized protein n=1 Tax=Actinomadura decatromicini TaxID=2604572 RepID=A0A5D3FMI5_9ACTN|nr:hypothetical protein [Actinomadura decatromicini]TYK49126.1 hypothetical protein FXF68_15035 [Actinomadura decatromicini]